VGSTSAAAPERGSSSQRLPSKNPAQRPTVEDMNSALLTVTLSAAIAAAAVAVRARLAPRPAPAPALVRLHRDEVWHPHVSSGCGR
jgi:hypothetical protein